MTAGSETAAELTGTSDEPISIGVLADCFNCTIKRGDDSWLAIKNGKYLRFSSAAYHLLLARVSGISSSDIADTINRRAGTAQPISAAEIEASYQQLFQQLSDWTNVPATRGMPWGFWVRWQLIPQRLVSRLASPLTLLFNLAVALSTVTSIICWLYFSRGSLTMSVSTHSWVPAYLLFLCSLVVHELGHAAACLRYKVVPNDIGFTLYLIYPALYADVSPAWELNRWKRVVVDLGGCYLQFLLAGVYFAAFRVGHWEPFRLSVMMILYAIVFSLNPVFKFDGYWLLADALDVRNLSSQPSKLVAYVYSQLRGRITTRLPHSPWLLIVLGLYSLLSLSIWTAFITHLLPRVLQIVRQTASLLSLVGSYKWHAVHPSGSEVLSIFANAITFISLLLMTYAALSRVYKLASSLIRKLHGRFTFGGRHE
jgi:putative peptide zinc metalloprotease protein